MSAKTERDAIRAYYVNLFTEFLRERGEEVLITKSNQRAWPVVGNEDGEYYCTLTVAVPTGSDKGMTPYDGYAMAEDYEMSCKAKAEKAKENAERKAKKVARDAEVRKRKAEISAKKGE